jgi:hypothetical protein
MPHRIIRTPADLEAYVVLLGTLRMPFTAQHKQGADRSLDQNALQFLWANEAAQQRGDRTFIEVRREWKLRHGVPILRRDEPDFRAKYDKHVRPLPYEEKVEFMDMIDVTSIMGVRQMTEYLDMVQRECAQQGIRLTDPETQKAA